MGEDGSAENGEKGATGEPRLGCLSSLGSQRKGVLGDRFGGLAWDKL